MLKIKNKTKQKSKYGHCVNKVRRETLKLKIAVLYGKHINIKNEVVKIYLHFPHIEDADNVQTDISQVATHLCIMLWECR